MDLVDYIGKSGFVTFTGQTAERVISNSIAILDDNVLENAENFTVFIAADGPSGVTIPTSTITITITDNDVGTVRPMQDSYIFSEPDGTVQITFEFLGELERDVVVNVASMDQTAVAGDDYLPVSEVITFTPSHLTDTVSLVILSDVIFEETECFQITLSLQNPLDQNVIHLDPDFVTITIDGNSQTIVIGVPEPVPTSSTDDDVDTSCPASGSKRCHDLLALSVCVRLQATGGTTPQFCSTLFDMYT